jgi:uncharacterized protein YbjT (DUF2867 family)
MKIFITGGAGFVGTAVISSLLTAGHSVHALVNHRSLAVSEPGVRSFKGDLFDDKTLDSAMAGCNAVIHLIGIIFENRARGITFDRIHYQGTVKVVDAAKRAGIRRYLHMSALGASVDSKSAYLQSKFKAEQYVQSSGLDWTVVEPSLIHGPGGDFTKTQAAWARGTAMPFVFMPYFGSGLLGLGQPGKIQPVFVGDVARAFTESLENVKTNGQILRLGGPEQMTWPHMHRVAAEVICGKPRATLAIPAWYAKAIACVVPAGLLPFTHDQVLMAETDNVCDLSHFEAVFGWKPREFKATLREYAERLP